jgi:hypothetical protein
MLFVCGFIFLVKTSRLPLKLLRLSQWLILSCITIFRIRTVVLGGVIVLETVSSHHIHSSLQWRCKKLFCGW